MIVLFELHVDSFYVFLSKRTNTQIPNSRSSHLEGPEIYEHYKLRCPRAKNTDPPGLATTIKAGEVTGSAPKLTISNADIDAKLRTRRYLTLCREPVDRAPSPTSSIFPCLGAKHPSILAASFVEWILVYLRRKWISGRTLMLVLWLKWICWWNQTLRWCIFVQWKCWMSGIGLNYILIQAVNGTALYCAS